MNPIVIEDLLKARFKANERLELLRDEAARLRLSGHQEDVTLRINIGNRSPRALAIAQVDRNQNYAAVQIRGMEMIMLGVKKWYAAAIDDAKASVADIENRIREATK